MKAPKAPRLPRISSLRCRKCHACHVEDSRRPWVHRRRQACADIYEGTERATPATRLAVVGAFTSAVLPTPHCVVLLFCSLCTVFVLSCSVSHIVLLLLLLEGRGRRRGRRRKEGGEERSGRCRNKNKNPTTQCGEKDT